MPHFVIHACTTHTRPTLGPFPAGRVLATPRRLSTCWAPQPSHSASATQGIADQTAGRVRHAAPTFSSQPRVHMPVLSATHTQSAPLPALSVPSACATLGLAARTVHSAQRVRRARSKTPPAIRHARPVWPTLSLCHQTSTPTTPSRPPRLRSAAASVAQVFLAPWADPVLCVRRVSSVKAFWTVAAQRPATTITPCLSWAPRMTVTAFACQAIG